MIFSWTLLIVFGSSVFKSYVCGDLILTVYEKALETLNESTLEALDKVTGRDMELNEIEFYISTTQNRGNETLLDPLDPIELTSRNGKIFFLLHGWIDSRNYSDWYQELTNRLLNRFPDAHVVQVDWSSASYQDFGSAAYSIESIGSHIAALIGKLVKVYGVPIENFVLIGHAMGAHICGWIGKYFHQFTDLKLGRIIALDPQGSIFKKRSDSGRLNRDDAYIVHVIHTDGKRHGLMKPCGTIDFYPNSGFDQPGCQNINLKSPLRVILDVEICSHIRATDYFLEAIRYPGSFLAHRCANEAALQMRRCNGSEVGMGDLSTIQEGLFYLETNSEPPFSKLGTLDKKKN